MRNALFNLIYGPHSYMHRDKIHHFISSLIYNMRLRRLVRKEERRGTRMHEACTNPQMIRINQGTYIALLSSEASTVSHTFWMHIALLSEANITDNTIIFKSIKNIFIHAVEQLISFPFIFFAVHFDVIFVCSLFIPIRFVGIHSLSFCIWKSMLNLC